MIYKNLKAFDRVVYKEGKEFNFFRKGQRRIPIFDG